MLETKIIIIYKKFQKSNTKVHSCCIDNNDTKSSQHTHCSGTLFVETTYIVDSKDSLA